MDVQETGSQFRAEIERVSYRNEENGWTVLRARNVEDQSLITATGHFAAVQAGQEFELFGSWSRHPTYGLQFKIDRIVPVRPTTAAAIEKYLASGLLKGIGPKTAERIVEHFGDKTLDVLDQTPARLLEVGSIGRKKAEAILASWDVQRGESDVLMFLNAHGISPLFAARIRKTYGPDAIKIVSADPYRLATDIQGIGFLSADKIARSVGIALDSAERIRAAVVYQLQQAEDRGHCYVTTPQLLKMLVDSLGLQEDQVTGRLADALTALNSIGAIVTEPQGHFRADLLIAELNVAQRAKELLTIPLATDHERVQGWIDKYTEVAGTPLSEEQLDAVKKAVSSRVFILTGGPGVGKTTTANAVIRLLKAMGRSVALAAPTGRAAQRLTEVAAAPAKTIHRLLEWVPRMATFARDENNPLTVDAVIIDEASMLDIRLADALIRAVGKNAQLILIGDIDQLPSVGPGNVLRDLIDSGMVPFTRLSRIFRQASFSRIIRTAHAINGGVAPEFDDDPASDCRFVIADSADSVKTEMEALLTGELKTRYGFDPAQDVQILTPMNRGDLGTQALNEELQTLLNPAKPGLLEFKRGSLQLRAGDKVIQGVNNYDLGVFNGDIGFVQNTNLPGGKLIVAFGDRAVTYEDEAILDLKLAYAITIHKSQGSEFPAVLIPCSMQHFVMLQRNLIYTALTRARKLAIFIGSRKALSFAVHNQTSLKRQTSLIDKLRRT